MSTTDLARLTQQHTNRGSHLRLLAHVEAVTGMTPDVRIDESGEYAVAVWWGDPCVSVCTEFDDTMTSARTYLQVAGGEGEHTSVTGLIDALSTAQKVYNTVVAAAETPVKATQLVSTGLS